ncbi:hypothetical protein SAMN05421734_10591 [Pelagirhabdus alkalitolerans]|uniref:Uncharacterized protein n=1 Tax=Pelagirhabdus alkalitolerans TaxID=1612202 RepID=A0A1G6JML1_9BACI|nr:hypothetical protein [Pelagirhabdus alkalitolerans]SDC19943.1 hypothetical protein SAMN05421734_10591 [Pelagirhabdus alkalitolerans]
MYQTWVILMIGYLMTILEFEGTDQIQILLVSGFILIGIGLNTFKYRDASAKTAQYIAIGLAVFHIVAPFLFEQSQILHNSAMLFKFVMVYYIFRFLLNLSHEKNDQTLYQSTLFLQRAYIGFFSLSYIGALIAMATASPVVVMLVLVSTIIFLITEILFVVWLNKFRKQEVV